MSNSDAAQKKPRALVTGANGFMGTHMVELLVREGYEVLATDIGAEKSKVTVGVDYEYEQCDLTVPDQVGRLVNGCGPFDYVFHVAALFDYSAPVDLLRKVNVQGTQNLLWALTHDSECHTPKSRDEMPKHFVMWGAAGVYDFAKESPAKETSPTNPQGGYLTTKWEAEQAVLESGKLGLPVSIIRPAGVYGPRSRYGVAMSILIAARGGMGPFYFGSKTIRPSMVHAVDVCRAAEFVAKKPEAAGQIYNVGDESDYTIYDLMATAAKYLGFPLLPIAFPLAIQKFFVRNLMKKAAKMGRVSNLNIEMLALLEFDSRMDISKLRALGWRPQYPDAKKGLLETIDWYEKEGWL